MPRIRAVISGHVQGVGFRRWVQAQAEQLDLEGEVFNSTDGSVVAEAQHSSQDVLDWFVERLPQGPGRVAAVDVSDIPEAPREPGFRITSTRWF